MANLLKAEANAALQEMHQAAIAAGRDPLAPSPVIEVPSNRPPPPPEIRFPRPNWDQVIRAEKAAEREARVREAAALLEAAAPPPQPDPPAKAGRWRRSGP